MKFPVLLFVELTALHVGMSCFFKQAINAISFRVVSFFQQGLDGACVIVGLPDQCDEIGLDQDCLDLVWFKI